MLHILYSFSIHIKKIKTMFYFFLNLFLSKRALFNIIMTLVLILGLNFFLYLLEVKLSIAIYFSLFLGYLFLVSVHFKHPFETKRKAIKKLNKTLAFSLLSISLLYLLAVALDFFKLMEIEILSWPFALSGIILLLLDLKNN